MLETVGSAISEEIIEALGGPIRYLPGDGTNTIITAIFDRVTNFVETEDGNYRTFEARVDCKSSDVEEVIEGSQFEKNGVAFYVASEPESDNLGVTTCRLKKS